MKTLKFRRALVPLVLDGTKTATWRLFDDKDLRVDDELSLVCWEDGSAFARAVATAVWQRPLGALTDEEREGHERFASDDEMYATYTTYYKRPVTKDTLVTIVRFELRTT